MSLFFVLTIHVLMIRVILSVNVSAKTILYCNCYVSNLSSNLPAAPFTPVSMTAWSPLSLIYRGYCEVIICFSLMGVHQSCWLLMNMLTYLLTISMAASLSNRRVLRQFEHVWQVILSVPDESFCQFLTSHFGSSWWVICIVSACSPAIA